MGPVGRWGLVVGLVLIFGGSERRAWARSGSSRSSRTRCGLNGVNVNEHNFAAVVDELGVGILAALCGRNRGQFVIGDGHAYSCAKFPRQWSVADATGVAKAYKAGNLSAQTALTLYDDYVAAVYTSAGPAVGDDVHACDANGFIALRCDREATAMPRAWADVMDSNNADVVRAVTLSGLFTKAPWAVDKRDPASQNFRDDSDRAHHWASFYTEDDFRDMAEGARLNAVKIPVPITFFATGIPDEAHPLSQVILSAAKHKLAVIISTDFSYAAALAPSSAHVLENAALYAETVRHMNGNLLAIELEYDPSMTTTMTTCEDACGPSSSSRSNTSGGTALSSSSSSSFSLSSSSEKTNKKALSPADEADFGHSANAIDEFPSTPSRPSNPRNPRSGDPTRRPTRRPTASPTAPPTSKPTTGVPSLMPTPRPTRPAFDPHDLAASLPALPPPTQWMLKLPAATSLQTLPAQDRSHDLAAAGAADPSPPGALLLMVDVPLSHSATVADLASDSAPEDRSKLLYHESTACAAVTYAAFADCERGAAVFVGDGFNLAVDRCVEHSTVYEGQCDRVRGRLGSNWWLQHTRSYAARLFETYEARGLGWSFSTWKLSPYAAKTLADNPRVVAEATLKDALDAGLLPLQWPGRAPRHPTCAHPPVADFDLGDATRAPTASNSDAAAPVAPVAVGDGGPAPSPTTTTAAPTPCLANPDYLRAAAAAAAATRSNKNNAMRAPSAKKLRRRRRKRWHVLGTVLTVIFTLCLLLALAWGLLRGRLNKRRPEGYAPWEHAWEST